jgi:hypothetical protein
MPKSRSREQAMGCPSWARMRSWVCLKTRAHSLLRIAALRRGATTGSADGRFVHENRSLTSSRLMKKVVAADLPRHRALKLMEIWRGKPAATSRRTTFSSAS